MKKSRQKKHKALIIGAGNIAGGYDNPDSPAILTHAHAYKKYKQTELLGFYDINFKRAEALAEKWSSKAFRDLEKTINESAPDIISVCTPDSDHFSTLAKIADFKNKPKIVICEKPLTTKTKDTEKIIKLYKRKRIPLLVDHTHRFNKVVQDLALKIKKNAFGRVVSASAVYSKGILHGGIHVIDLARNFFGEVKKIKVLCQIKDYESETDRTIGAFIEFERCKQFYLMAGDERNYCFAQFDVICGKGRLYFPDFWFTLVERKVVKDPVFKGDRILGEPVVKSTNYGEALLNMVENAVKHIEFGQPLLCSGKDAGKTQEACLKLLNKILK